MEIRNAYTLPRSARPYVNHGALEQVAKLTDQNQELQRKLNDALEKLARERVARRAAEVRALQAGAELAARASNKTIESVIDVVCAVWGCSERDLLAPHRGQRASRPRQAAFWLAKKYCQAVSYPDIGRRFRRDHSTVMHGVEVASHRIATDPTYAEKMARAEAMLGKGPANG